MSDDMNQGRNMETEAEEEEEMVPQSESEKQMSLRNGNVSNQDLAPVKNNPQQQQVVQPQPEYQPRPEQPRIPQRAEGYRTSAIRESRIKDRPVSKTGASDSALKIKIELDLEVEVDLYARVKGDVTIGLM
ncbi:uncharacterized protein BP5553_03062 [Venustampulla echinocandica]|uniref:Uncharacterized protein n=1 Tax=Venustampulla echinocandica TaxID=2656787 RepID=A0A370TT66_9HELO|nr:uncharacterized protein BP5553_03062 [Venustampulla echinocandica]RDL38722.1 hypothetical protein BP5553_03062 [Venustampulla echinocandica]